MMRRTHLQEKPLSSSPQVSTKSRFAPRPFAPPVEVREPPSAESLGRAAQFGHSFADVDILPRPVVQPKLGLGPVGDKYEQEADEVARRVVETISSSDQESVQRQEDLEDEDELDLEESEELRRKVTGFAPAGGADIGPDLESVIQRARSGGQPLSDSVRLPMERAFGADFGGVRVHAGGENDRLSRSLQARAFTMGQDIFLRQREYRPESSMGQRLLAHELTHVVQQNMGAVALQFKHEELKSIDNLRNVPGGNNTQNTLAYIEIPEDSPNERYMIQQQTVTDTKNYADDNSIKYIPQGRAPRGLSMHAEMRFVRHASVNSISLNGATVWASNKICIGCAEVWKNQGGLLGVEESGELYDNWWDPIEGRQLTEDELKALNVRARGSIVRHKTEEETLRMPSEYYPKGKRESKKTHRYQST